MNIKSIIFIIFMNIILWMNTLCIFWSSLSTKSILFIIFKCFFNVFFLNLVSIVINRIFNKAIARVSLGWFADRSSSEAKLGQLPLVFLMLGMTPGGVSWSLVQRCLRLQGVLAVSQAMVLHLEVDGRGGVPVVHEPLLAQGVAGSRWNIGMALVVHHSNLCVLFRFEEDSIKLGKDQAAKLNYPRER